MTTTTMEAPRPAEYRPYVPPFHHEPFFNIYAGTGGVASIEYYQNRQGYSPFLIKDSRPAIADSAQAQYVRWMQEVKAGFGRTFSSLPQIFGVSRRTLYNWLEGDEPKIAHHAKLEQLAAAAREFGAHGFKPSSLTLGRTVARGQTFPQLLASGADGRATAQILIRLVTRGEKARASVDALLGRRTKTPIDPADLGQASFSEDV